MEFSIETRVSPLGEIYAENHALEYDLYLKEDVDYLVSLDAYKYSESASLYTIIKVEMDKSTLIDVLLDVHDTEIDSVTFKVERDGYYTLDNMVIPNLKWWKNASKEVLANYSTIYVTDGEKVYKAVKGVLEECTVKELLERNPEGTTIKKCKTNIFHTGNLLNCYINYCKQLFDSLLNICDRGLYKDLQYARDFIWMTLNIIDYLVGFKQYMEAERILEMFNNCGGYCKDRNIKKGKAGCGCSQG